MRTGKRAFTLPEVLVAGVILVMLSLIGFTLSQFATARSKKSDQNSETFRQGSQAVARLRRELRGSQIVSPTAGEATEIRFRYVALTDEGSPVLDFRGQPEWQGEARLFSDSGELKLEKPVGGPVQILARLYEGNFQVTVDNDFYTFTIVVKKAATPSEFRRQFRLAKED